MHALVLARYDIRESDQMITLITKEHGKRHVLARGIKKITSKNSSCLGQCRIANVDIIPGKRVDHLTRAIPVESFLLIQKDLKKRLLASYALVIVNRLLETNAPDPFVYDFLIAWLKELAQSKKPKVVNLDTFVLQLYSHFGLCPTLDHCVMCLEKKKLHGFIISGGGVICSNCRGGEISRGEKILPCGPGAQKVLKILVNKPDIAMRLNLTPQQYYIVHSCIYSFVRFYHERHIPDWGRISRLA